MNNSIEEEEKKKINKIHLGNSLDILKQMPSNFVDCVMTSPAGTTGLVALKLNRKFIGIETKS